MLTKDIFRWVEETWKPMLGYIPEVIVLVRGWYCFRFKEVVDVEMILERVWLYSSESLMMKRWTHLFDPEKEHIRFRHLWVLLPGCPLVFWNLEAFKVIGNTLGKFMHVDPQLLSGQDRWVGRILVEFDLQQGLPS
jgi:hypothetical protein